MDESSEELSRRANELADAITNQHLAGESTAIVSCVLSRLFGDLIECQFPREDWELKIREWMEMQIRDMDQREGPGAEVQSQH